MDHITRGSWWRVAVLVLLAGAGVTLAPREALGSSHCFSTHVSGSGPHALKICITEGGFLRHVESPAGVEHLGGEGYAVCSQGGAMVHGYAWEGFGPPIISQPHGANTLPLTITRDTTDGVFRLTQVFTRDATEPGVTITMTLTNLSSVSRSDVRLDRYFSGTLGGSPAGDRFARTVAAVWGWDDGTGHELMLTTLSPHFTPLTAVEYRSTWREGGEMIPGTHAGCVPSAEPTPTEPWPANEPLHDPGYAGRLTTRMDAFAPGQSKTITLQYRRF